MAKNAVHREVQELRAVRDVIGHELDVVASRSERFREPLHPQRRAATGRHGTRGNHRNPESHRRAGPKGVCRVGEALHRSGGSPV